jgi:metallo-beta-lactamase family protein
VHAEFHGAARTVTGSCTLLEAGGTRVLVDCGQFQGPRELEERNHEPFPFRPQDLDAVVLTHAHVDHVGRAPALLQQGFRGRVICTSATAELSAVMLLDAAKIAAEDARRGGPPPSYGDREVEQLYRKATRVRYGQRTPAGPGIDVTLSDAGHILGSAHVLASMREGGRRLEFGISGDVGGRDRPVVADPTPFAAVDHLQVEATYGDREHRPPEESLAELLGVLEDVERGGGVALVPAFALGRTQDVLWHVGRWKAEGRLPRLSTFVDSPLATRITELFRRHPEAYDDDARRVLADGKDPFDFPGLRFVADHDESERLPRHADRALIVASSGMCQSGRVVDHLAALLPLPTTRVVIVGFQAEGTLGRRLVERAGAVVVRGREVQVRATVHTLGGFSAHAGRSELLAWIRGRERPPRVVHLVHGEPTALDSLAKAVREQLRLETHVPNWRERVDL